MNNITATKSEEKEVHRKLLNFSLQENFIKYRLEKMFTNS